MDKEKIEKIGTLLGANKKQFRFYINDVNAKDRNGKCIYKAPCTKQGYITAPNTELYTLKDILSVKVTSKMKLGIGYFIAPNDDVVCMDIDALYDDTLCTIVNSEVREFVERSKGLLEVSLSGKGLHLWFKDPTHINRTKSDVAFEVEHIVIEGKNPQVQYFSHTSTRYIALSGDIVAGDELPLLDINDVFLSHWTASAKKVACVDTEDFTTPAMSDDEILNKCRTEGQFCFDFEAIYDRAEYKNADGSAGHWNIAKELRYWTQDNEQIERIMRASEAMSAHPKFDRGEYVMETIEGAAKQQLKRYNPNHYKQNDVSVTKKGTNADFIDFMLEGEVEALANTKAMSTGFFGLDNHLDGGIESGLYVIGGLSSLGKTTLVDQIANNIAAQSTDVLFFSLEMSRLEMVSKAISRTMYQATPTEAFTARQIRKGNKSSALSVAIQKYRNTAGVRMSVIESSSAITLKNIQSVVRQHISETGNKPLVVVDYLQVMGSEDVRLSDKQRVSTNVLGLKLLAREHNIPVFVVSSLNRASYEKAVSFESFKESGEIEYTADVVLGLDLSLVHEPALKLNKDVTDLLATAKRATPRKVTLSCLKNRFGITSFKQTFEYMSAYDMFMEV